MIEPWKLFGRLGNSMFQYAFLYSYARDKDIDFYFQNEKFFKNNEEAIRVLFSSGIPDPINKVAIHVRRGDYVNNPYYVDLMETDYYQRAMALFPNSKFIVFSDDIEWCKEQEVFEGCEFFNKSEIEDMNTMAACVGHIIANSSFSWWGAWLSPNFPDNRVIAPKLWFTDGVERTILPTHWKTI